jgi:heme/copper-type cytochrome/quinol oxidase subunit 2
MDARWIVPQDRQHPDSSPTPTERDQASNGPAITSLVLGIASNVLLLASAIPFFGSWDEPELDAWIWILYLISLVVALFALFFGAEGRRRAKNGSGRLMATMGVALATVFIVASIVIVILTLIAISAFNNDSL